MEEEIIKKPTLITSIADLYIETNNSIKEAITPKDTYTRVLESIIIGYSLLDDELLIKRVEGVLSDESTYVFQYNFQWDENTKTYTISTTGEKGTGIIHVQKEESGIGEQAYINQIATMKLRSLIPLNAQIFRSLAKSGKVPKRTWRATEMDDETMEELYGHNKEVKND